MALVLHTDDFALDAPRTSEPECDPLERRGCAMADRSIRTSVDATFGLAAPRDLAERSAANALDDSLLGFQEPRPRPFSVFHHGDAARAAALAEELGRIADAGGEADGLRRAVAAAAAVAAGAPGLARHALGLFATHHPLGQRTPIPSLLRRTAVRAAAVAGRTDVTLGSQSTGAEVVMDWFREDPLANEHHEHWHWVYPNNPPPNKPVKERHGELFYYMHEQMLARYDVERVAAGLAPVEPLTDFFGSIGEGYDPGLLVVGVDYEPRPAGAGMVDGDDYDRETLTELTRRLTTAARNRTLGSDAAAVPLDGHAGSDLLGHEAEPTRASRFPSVYGWHHGMGHLLIGSASSNDLGVMMDPATAIRDPAFWRWHRHVDDIHFTYQDALPPHSFDDRPAVALVTLGVEREDGTSLGTSADGASVLTTEMRTGVYQLLGGARYRFDYLRHDPFRVRVELRNDAIEPLPVTLRLFLIPHDLFSPNADPVSPAGRQMRRFAIELDKVKLEAPPGSSVHLRAGREMSVIRRPAVEDPAEVADVDGGNSDEASQQCTCGWPFGLLIPRGTPAGMPFSLFATLTDNRIDRIGSPKPCGSMSFCGMDDRYPDARPMGYPFDRPLAASLAAIVSANPTMRMLPISIRWTNAPA